MLTLYRCLWWLITPLAVLRLKKKSELLPAYGQRLDERKGFVPSMKDPVVWFHTVSVGESLAAIAMIKQIIAQHPNKTILVTTTTPTGSELVQSKLAGVVAHCYLPWDRRLFIERMLKRIQPELLVLMETEVWPELITQLNQKNIPIVLANARMSQRSAQGYLKIAAFSRSIFSKLSLVCAQSPGDLERFQRLGVHAVKVTGTVKFDVQLSDQARQLAQTWLPSLNQRFVWLAASTHPGEEAQMIAAHKQLLLTMPDALLILAPRHPERRDELASLLDQSELTYQLRSRAMVTGEQVWVLDSLGELVGAMGASHVVFMGGSLVEHGGHNPLEAGAWPRPVLSGPHYFNFTEVCNKLLAEQAMGIVDTPKALAEKLVLLAEQPELANDLALRLGRVLKQNRGSTKKQVAEINNLLSKTDASH